MYHNQFQFMKLRIACVITQQLQFKNYFCMQSLINVKQQGFTVSSVCKLLSRFQKLIAVLRALHCSIAKWMLLYFLIQLLAICRTVVQHSFFLFAGPLAQVSIENKKQKKQEEKRKEIKALPCYVFFFVLFCCHKMPSLVINILPCTCLNYGHKVMVF